MALERATWQKEGGSYSGAGGDFSGEGTMEKSTDRENREREEEEGKKGLDCLTRPYSIDPVFAIRNQRILCFVYSSPLWYGSFERMLGKKH